MTDPRTADVDAALLRELYAHELTAALASPDLSSVQWSYPTTTTLLDGVSIYHHGRQFFPGSLFNAEDGRLLSLAVDNWLDAQLTDRMKGKAWREAVYNARKGHRGAADFVTSVIRGKVSEGAMQLWELETN